MKRKMSETEMRREFIRIVETLTEEEKKALRVLMESMVNRNPGAIERAG